MDSRASEPPILCLVTGPAESRQDWPDAIRAVVAAGVDWIQVRDRSLSAGDLLAFTRALGDAARDGARRRDGAVQILVNRRADVALAAPADGVHLGFDAAPLAALRRLHDSLGRSGLLGVAAHSVEEVAMAAEAGADYAHLAPIFDPLSKPAERPALGPVELTRAAARSSGRSHFRLLAQGGIDARTARTALQAGAHGIAVTGAVLGATHPGTAAAQLRATLDEIRVPPA